MKLASLITALSFTVSGVAFAADAPPTAPATGSVAPSSIQRGGPGVQGGMGHHEMRGDENHDGFISREEWRKHGEELFNEIDTNHDGKISPEEMRAHREHEREEWKEHHEGGNRVQSGAGANFHVNQPAPAAPAAPAH